MKIFFQVAPLMIIGAFALLPNIGEAHSFGKLYSLPVPFWMYLYGAAAALFASFLVIGYLYDTASSRDINKEIIKPRMEIRIVSIIILKLASVAVFLIILLSGLIGENSSYANINMVLFWIYVMLGVTYLSALFGDFARFINPWKSSTNLFGIIKWEGFVNYPKILGYYPALVLYFGLIWFELVGGATPLLLSVVLLQYTFINITGILVLGTEVWFKYCEFFSVFFDLVSKISPVEFRDGGIFWKGFFGRLINEKSDHPSMVIFIIFMLASTAFDGFKETLPWSRVYVALSESYIRPSFGAASYSVFQTIGLVIAPMLFFALYVAAIGLAKLITSSKKSISNLLQDFAFSLIPIAVVYNVAHYFTLIFSEGPSLIRLISDPFGWGWNLFGTASVYTNYIVPTNIVWHVQVAVILIGHIIGVYVAHMIALKGFTSKRNVILSQIPLLLLMVVYTVAGLWILSQPITNGS